MNCIRLANTCRLIYPCQPVPYLLLPHRRRSTSPCPPTLADHPAQVHPGRVDCAPRACPTSADSSSRVNPGPADCPTRALLRRATSQVASIHAWPTSPSGTGQHVSRQPTTRNDALRARLRRPVNPSLATAVRPVCPRACHARSRHPAPTSLPFDGPQPIGSALATILGSPASRLLGPVRATCHVVRCQVRPRRILARRPLTARRISPSHSDLAAQPSPRLVPALAPGVAERRTPWDKCSACISRSGCR